MISLCTKLSRDFSSHQEHSGGSPRLHSLLVLQLIFLHPPCTSLLHAPPCLSLLSPLLTPHSTHSSALALLTPCLPHLLHHSPLNYSILTLLTPYPAHHSPFIPTLSLLKPPHPSHCPDSCSLLTLKLAHICPSPNFLLGIFALALPIDLCFSQKLKSLHHFSSQCKCHLIRRAPSLPLFESHRSQDFIRAVSNPCTCLPCSINTMDP